MGENNFNITSGRNQDVNVFFISPFDEFYNSCHIFEREKSLGQKYRKDGKNLKI